MEAGHDMTLLWKGSTLACVEWWAGGVMFSTCTGVVVAKSWLTGGVHIGTAFSFFATTAAVFFFQTMGEGKGLGECAPRRRFERRITCTSIVGQPGEVGLSLSLKCFSFCVFFQVKSLSISLGELN